MRYVVTFCVTMNYYILMILKRLWLYEIKILISVCVKNKRDDSVSWIYALHVGVWGPIVNTTLFLSFTGSNSQPKSGITSFDQRKHLKKLMCVKSKE